MRISPVRLGQNGVDLPAASGWLAGAGLGLGGLGLVGLVGCASPGPPRPPSLSLPAVVADLAAERVGDDVVLRWTTSAETTDGLPVGGRPMTAEICREERFAGSGPAACVPVARLAIPPGPSSATDVLPASLVAGGPEVLGYEVRLLNGAGRSAGWSGVAFSAAGAAPVKVTLMAVRPTERGAEITWAPEAGQASFEIERLEVAPQGMAGGGADAGGAIGKTRGGSKDGGKEVRLSVRGGEAGELDGFTHTDVGQDPGGAIDRDAQMGKAYVYRVQRVRTVTLAGHAAEIRGPMSEPVEVRMRDIFPPGPPTGLAGISACLEGKLGVDLSWEANGESDLAGYFVYRAQGVDGGAWTKLTARAVEASAFRDAGVPGGSALRYRVTATDRSGNESAPSAALSVGAEELGVERCSARR